MLLLTMASVCLLLVPATLPVSGPPAQGAVVYPVDI